MMSATIQSRGLISAAIEAIRPHALHMIVLTAAILLSVACGRSGDTPDAVPANKAPEEASAQAADDAQPLRFDIVEGKVLNAFYRHERIAAHMLLSSGDKPRLLFAFPAGNSGIGMWFDTVKAPVQWTLSDLRGIQAPDTDSRMLYGVEADAAVDAARLNIREVVVGNVRVLRDYQALGKYPQTVAVQPVREGKRVTWARNRLDGAPGYALSVEVVDGDISGDDKTLAFVAAAGKPLRLRMRALSGDTPLTPLTASRLFTAQAGNDTRSRQALEFLSYDEKFLAGSWRFNTYFGRDTLMSVRLLLPAITPEATEAGLGSVLSRLDPAGEVAHEEDLSEFALLRRQQAKETPSAEPIYDYAMVDDDYMLAPVMAAYLLDTDAGKARTAAFLQRKTPAGEAYGRALARNFAWVVASAKPFAQQQDFRRLIALKAGRAAGQWRDSNDGLGDGRYAYDVNAVFVPDALESIARFAASGALKAYLSPEQSEALAQAQSLAKTWGMAAPPMFAVDIDPATAQRALTAYAKAEGVDPSSALNALADAPLRMNAIALDDNGKPIPVLHSDDGFALLFGDPPAADVERSVTAMMRPFPAGLMTDVGLLVANPAYANASVRARLGRNAYHGTVIWAWQQAVLAAGLDRQIARKDLPEPLRAQLIAARRELWRAIDAARDLRTSELWSWSQQDGKYKVEPFGQRGGDADESNAAQLWSTVFLALRSPQHKESSY
jgi:glycogen debranching enzyme